MEADNVLFGGFIALCFGFILMITWCMGSDSATRDFKDEALSRGHMQYNTTSGNLEWYTKGDK